METATRGKAIRLRPLTPADREELARLADNPDIARYLDFLPNPYTLADADAWIARTEAEHPRCNFAIEYDGRLAGSCGINPCVGVHSGTAEVGYWVGEPYWNNGVATRAVALLCGYALDDLLFIRLQARVFAPNAASVRVLEKNAFHREAILRKHIRKNGHIYDCHLYARLRNP